MDVIESLSSLVAAGPGVMRKVGDNCIYNLQALSTASGREEFTA